MHNTCTKIWILQQKNHLESLPTNAQCNLPEASPENECKNINERLTCLQAALIATMKMFLNKWESWPFSKIRKLSNCWKVETWEMSVYYSTLMQEKHFDIFRWKYWLHLFELGASWLSSVQKVSRCNRPSPFASVYSGMLFAPIRSPIKFHFDTALYLVSYPCQQPAFYHVFYPHNTKKKILKKIQMELSSTVFKNNSVILHA